MSVSLCVSLCRVCVVCLRVYVSMCLRVCVVVCLCVLSCVSCVCVYVSCLRVCVSVSLVLCVSVSCVCVYCRVYLWCLFVYVSACLCVLSCVSVCRGSVYCGVLCRAVGVRGTNSRVLRKGQRTRKTREHATYSIYVLQSKQPFHSPPRSFFMYTNLYIPVYMYCIHASKQTTIESIYPI